MAQQHNFEHIYKQHMHDLLRYLLSLTRRKESAEDLMQETFYRALLHLETYKGEEVKPWLFKIAYHAFIDWYRKEKKRPTVEIEEWHFTPQPSAEEQVMIQSEIEGWLSDVSALPPAKQNIVLLRDYHGFTYEEIAEMTGYTLSKVKMDLYRGRQQLKKRKEEDR
ncbi:RNA polymerase sigma factor [Priestia megaterium]|uniref:RNA polymerase sigma factor n=1 Tax=Priestia megaterium TaxID=1404 RepID=UPI002E1A49D5|nr:RNA polymerase sigma factor [Priestia megaterium]